MGREVGNPTVTGKGSIPAGVGISGTTLDTHATLKTRIEVTGPQVQNKTVLIGNYIYSEGEVREVMGFFPNGDISIKTAFTSDLSASDLVVVKNGQYFVVSVNNISTTITGTINGDTILPGVGYKFEQLKGLKPITYDTDGASFLVAITQQ